MNRTCSDCQTAATGTAHRPPSEKTSKITRKGGGITDWSWFRVKLWELYTILHQTLLKALSLYELHLNPLRGGNLGEGPACKRGQRPRAYDLPKRIVRQETNKV